MSNPDNALFYSATQIDQIIGTFTNTVSLSAPTSGGGYTAVTDSKAHGFGDSTYFQGIFTTNGGTTWNDFGAQTPNGTQFQTVDVEAMINSTNCNVYLTNYYDYVHSRGTAYTATYKIYLIAKNTMAQPITPLSINSNTYFNSANNYQKIFTQGTVPISVSGGSTGSTATITHNLGVIPKIRAFFNSSNQIFSLNQYVVPPAIEAPIEAHITTSTLVFYTDQSGFGASGVSGNIEYRIYYDS